MANFSRRGFLTGAGLLVAAPAIVKIENIMRVRSYPWMEGPWAQGLLARWPLDDLVQQHIVAREFSIEKMSVSARSRNWTAGYVIEIPQDLIAMHSIELEESITNYINQGIINSLTT
jgi:hypothetical protein